MGRPTNEAIMRKLIRKFFKFDLKKKSTMCVAKYIPQLEVAWDKHGMDSKEAQAIQDKIDAEIQKDEQDYITLKKSVKKYPIMMNKILAKPKNKHQKKSDKDKSYFRKQINTNNEETDPIYGYKF